MVPQRGVFSPEVAERIGPFYVYLLIDPRNGLPFYVGKGSGDRVAQHGSAALLAPVPGEPKAAARIREIRNAGDDVSVDIIRHGIDDAATAFEVEAALIDALPDLVNAQKGRDTPRGRAPAGELLRRFGAPPLEAQSPPALIVLLTGWTPFKEEIEPGYYRNGYGWRPDMTGLELYDAARAWWRRNPRELTRRGVNHIVAAAEGVTRAVYEITGTFGPRGEGPIKRWAFSGDEITSGAIYEDYVGELGRRLPLKRGTLGPIYWPRPDE